MTVLAEVKALLDQVAGLTANYRAGNVPDDAVFPYTSTVDPVSDVVALAGDSRTLARRHVIQVDLWLDWGDVSHDALPDTVADVLDGVRISSGRLRVQDVNLIPEPDIQGRKEAVHVALTVSVVKVR